MTVEILSPPFHQDATLFEVCTAVVSGRRHITDAQQKDNGIQIHIKSVGPPIQSSVSLTGLVTPPLCEPAVYSGVPWSPQSWRLRPMQQAVAYANPAELEATCDLLSQFPELVSPAQIESARKAFHDVALGKAFIIQGGDCAESFSDRSEERRVGKECPV